MTYALEVLGWVHENRPQCMKFVPFENDIRSIAVYLEVNQQDSYTTMTLMYGILFTLAVLDYCVENENYEQAAVIVASIKRTNLLYKTNLPTTLDSPWCKENMNLSPSEMLAKHFKGKL